MGLFPTKRLEFEENSCIVPLASFLCQQIDQPSNRVEQIEDGNRIEGGIQNNRSAFVSFLLCDEGFVAQAFSDSCHSDPFSIGMCNELCLVIDTRVGLSGESYILFARREDCSTRRAQKEAADKKKREKPTIFFHD